MKKVIGILFMLCFSVVLMSTFVYADTVTFSATTDKTTLKPGDEVVLTLKIAEIDVSTSGINAVEAKLEYDNSIFEHVQQADVSGAGSWSVVYNDENTEYGGKLLAMILSTGTKKAGDVARIKLKVKKEITSTTLTKQVNLKIINIETNNGESIIKDSDKIVPVTIQFDKVVQADPSETVTIGSGGLVAGDTQRSAGTVDKTTAEGNVPQTGTNELIFIGLFILFIGVGAIAYIRYKNIILK